MVPPIQHARTPHLPLAKHEVPPTITGGGGVTSLEVLHAALMEREQIKDMQGPACCDSGFSSMKRSVSTSGYSPEIHKIVPYSMNQGAGQNTRRVKAPYGKRADNRPETEIRRKPEIGKGICECKRYNISRQCANQRGIIVYPSHLHRMNPKIPEDVSVRYRWGTISHTGLFHLRQNIHTYHAKSSDCHNTDA